MFYEGRAGQEWLEALKPLGTDADKSFLEIAPYLICIFGARRSPGADGRMRKNYYVPESVGIASGLPDRSVASAGLATLTHTPAPMGFLNEICGRPDNDKPYILLVTGYPAPDATIPPTPHRRSRSAKSRHFCRGVCPRAVLPAAIRRFGSARKHRSPRSRPYR